VKNCDELNSWIKQFATRWPRNAAHRDCRRERLVPLGVRHAHFREHGLEQFAVSLG